MYTLEITPRFEKELKKLDKYTQKILSSWISKNLENTTNLRILGKSLKGDKSGQWRYRIGDYRLICQIIDDKLIILSMTIGHRRDIYKT